MESRCAGLSLLRAFRDRCCCRRLLLLLRVVRSPVAGRQIPNLPLPLAAAPRFSGAVDLVPLRCKLGGLASLQKAICLDSLGRNAEAYPIYVSIQSHTAPGVSKAARRLLFGFKASEFLKVETMTFAPGSQAWKAYFDRIPSSSWTAAIYTATDSVDEEDDRSARSAGLVAAAVMLLPLALVAFRVLTK